MTIYEYLIDICEGFSRGEKPYEPIVINLDRRYVAIGNKVLVRNGEILADTGTFDGFIRFEGDPYQEIERLYAQYKHSVPSKQESLNKGPFKALSSDRLTMRELENNMPRHEARIRLEAFICLGACEGIIPWHIRSHFFWRGADPDCIIYRNWILNDTKEETPHD